MSENSPLPLAKRFVENPVVLKVAPYYLLALYDSDAPHAVGYSVSADGVHWTPEQVLVVQSENNRWSGNDGLRDVRTPLGLIPEKDGNFRLLYTAKMKSQPFYAVGECMVHLTMEKTPIRITNAQ